ncbi:hypothetical protein L1987_58674 [Smallanthus sonchifolius]|uniref:Uncharacterized protein n=1 Tax=Smallanthus sonchifolius TaxID=185202 RepID=A0ACB9D3E9_9ASTR|nr:hypothetical protein L1987_58674 [Smallanthus sonchifolius]
MLITLTKAKAKRMVREKTSDEKVICSSIAMLQERFRQLEKVKEMREERELLKLINSSASNNNHHHHHNLYFLGHSDPKELLTLSLSLSLWPNSQQQHHVYSWDINTPSWLPFPLPPPSFTNTTHHDVDTTLHL